MPRVRRGGSLRDVERSGPGDRGGTPPSEWMLVGDSALGALLRLLADAPEPDVVAEALAGVLAGFNPEVVAIGTVRPEQDVLVIAGLHGVDGQVRHLYASVPLGTDLPATRCVRVNDVVSGPVAQLAQQYPLLTPYLEAVPTSLEGEFATFPIRFRGAVAAVLGLQLARPLGDPWALRAAVATLTGPLVLWAQLRGLLDERADSYWSRRPDRPLAVTARQQQVLDLVRAGRTNAQIAADLGYSVPTVKSELARLCALLGATGRADLAERAARAGL